MEVRVFSTDPGLATLLDSGSVFNVVQQAVIARRFATGTAVLGLVGGVVNDLGAPGVAVSLAGGVNDLRTIYGGFSPYLGDGAASGYEGNLYARAIGVDAPQIVLMPVDNALKDATIATGTDLLLSLTRSDAANGAKVVKAGTRFSNHPSGTAVTGSGTGEADDDTITASAAHGLVVGDPVVFTTLTGGTGLSLATTYYVASIPLATTFTVSGTPGGSAVDITLDYSAMAWTSAAWVVATLEDVSYTTTETGSKTVRIRHVSGTPIPLDAVTTFVDTIPDSNITVNTTATTVADEIDAAELLLRYQSAISAILDELPGQAITVLAADRDESGVADALDAHAVLATSRGFWRVACIAPPNTTTAAAAEGTTGDGVGRITLDGARTTYSHPGVRRPFLLDSANLTSPDYLVTLPSAVAFAARVANTPPWENPARPHQVLRTYGITGLETLSTAVVPVTHYRANIAQPEFTRQGGQLRASFRDGITVAGTKIADVRLSDFLSAGLVDALSSYQKAPGTPQNREDAENAAIGFLQREKDDAHIAGYAVAITWDADNDHFTVSCAADKTGNMDTITIQLVVGGNAVAESGIEEAA